MFVFSQVSEVEQRERQELMSKGLTQVSIPVKPYLLEELIEPIARYFSVRLYLVIIAIRRVVVKAIVVNGVVIIQLEKPLIAEIKVKTTLQV